MSNLLAYQGGNYSTILQKLWFLQKIGANAVHISCPFASARPRYDHWSGLTNPYAHGFCPTNFRDLNLRFGSENELRSFVRGCQEAGIKVIGEMTFHFGPGSSFPVGWATDRKYWCMKVLPRLNLSNPQVRSYVLQTIEWFADLGFYGLRLDTAFELPLEFLALVVEAAQRRGLFLVGEVFNGNPQYVQDLPKGIFWTDYPLNFQLFEVIAGRGAVSKLHDLLSHPYSRECSLATFVSNHDVASMVRECVKRSSDPDTAIKHARARMLMALALIFVVRGVPAIYYLDSWALSVEGMADPLGTNRIPTPWGQRPVLADAISKLTVLRQTRPEFAHGRYVELWLPGPAQVWAFARVGRRSTIVLVNNEDHSIDLASLGGIDAQGYLPPGTVRCLVRPGKTFSVEGGRLYGKLAPRSVYLLGS